MMGHKICFYEEILIIIPKFSFLLLLIWSPDLGESILSTRGFWWMFPVLFDFEKQF